MEDHDEKNKTCKSGEAAEGDNTNINTKLMQLSRSVHTEWI